MAIFENNMTVKELIEKLSQLDPNEEVQMGIYTEIGDTKRISWNKIKTVEYSQGTDGKYRVMLNNYIYEGEFQVN